MNKATGTLKIVLLCLIAVLAGGLWAASTVGLIDFRDLIAKLPYASKIIKEGAPDEKSPQPVIVSPIEKENKELRAKIRELETQTAGFEGEKTKLLQQVETMQKELISLRKYKTENENRALNAVQLAAYYQEMKAEAVVKVMNNLDDYTVIMILPLLEKDHTAKILSLMEPQRAALLTQLLLGISSPEEN